MSRRVRKAEASPPSKFWAYAAVIVGGLLFLAGLAAFGRYFGLPLTTGRDVLGEQLGQMAGVFLGLICGPLAVVHGIRSIRGRPSRRFTLPPAYVFYLLFAVVLGLGNLLLEFDVGSEFLFPPVFFLGAALPTAAVIAWAGRRLGWPVTWRQAALALVSGSTLSVALAILLEMMLPSLALVLIGPLEGLSWSIVDLLQDLGPGFLDRLFVSPAIIVFLLFIAFQAPIPEELAKALGITLFGRRRIQNERQAFMLGLCAGAGFAVLENMLYEGLYAQWSGWTWGGVTLIRGLGSVLHPIGTGLVALSWFRFHRARQAGEGGWGCLFRGYMAAVGLHTLWNGGFEPLVFLTGVDRFYGALGEFSMYGLYVEGLLVAFLVALSGGLWWLLRRLTVRLAEGITPEAVPAAVPISRRALALWALISVLVIVPIGAALGPAWRAIAAVIFGGN